MATCFASLRSFKSSVLQKIYIKLSYVTVIDQACNVQVRDELEHLLDDDEDMVELYMTEKLVQQQLEDSSTSSLNEGNDMDDDELQADSDDRCLII
jgi:hypothetical protein